MLKLTFTFLFVLIYSCTIAQKYEKEYAVNFAYKIKQVEQFMDRFNGTDTAFISYYQKHNPGKTLTREQLLKSLFNSESKNWNYTEISEFINKVNDKNNPILLDFYSDGWYAKLNCAVKWKGLSKTVILKLKVEKDENSGYKWIISGVDAGFLEPVILKGSKKNYISFKLPPPHDPNISLDPSSNGTEFMDIDQVANDKKNISNYFYKADNYSDELPLFVTECLNGHLSISQVNNIKYCFPQVPGWYFETAQYNRPTKNSGWLIASIRKTEMNK